MKKSRAHTQHKSIHGLEVWLHSFLTSALDETEWLASHPGWGKQPTVHTDHRLGGPQSRFGRFGEKKSLAPTVIWNPDRQVRRLVTKHTELQQLKYEHHVHKMSVSCSATKSVDSNFRRDEC